MNIQKKIFEKKVMREYLVITFHKATEIHSILLSQK